MGQTRGQRHQQTQQQITIANRRKMVVANVLAGATYDVIATSLNVSKSTVASDMKAILRDWRQHYTDDADKYVQVQLRRYDVMLNALWDSARTGQTQAIDRVLAIMDRQNAILGINRANTEARPSVSISVVEVHHDSPGLQGVELMLPSG